MKKNISLVFVAFLIILSCKGPETIVTNFVNRDGSILRKVEMRNSKNEFNRKNFRVPVDSSWKFSDSISIAANGDTTWYVFAEKLFRNAGEINAAYLTDSSSNRAVKRVARFEKKFRWFTTVYRFSEECEKSMANGYPYQDFLTEEQVKFMQLPSDNRSLLLSGSDSTYYKMLSDSTDARLEKWYIRSLISEWIEEAAKLCASAGKDSLNSTILRSYEGRFNSMPDTLNFSRVISTVLGDKVYNEYQAELDSAIINAERRFDRSISFEEYTMQISMPYKVISSNGFQNSGSLYSWPVRGELFLCSDYVMEVSTRVVNYWMIVITILILVIALAGTFRYYYRKNKLDN